MRVCEYFVSICTASGDWFNTIEPAANIAEATNFAVNDLKGKIEHLTRQGKDATILKVKAQIFTAGMSK